MGRTKIAVFHRKSYKTLQAMARKTAAFQREINSMGVMQGELYMLEHLCADRSQLVRVFRQRFEGVQHGIIYTGSPLKGERKTALNPMFYW